MIRKKIKRRANKFTDGGWSYNAPELKGSIQGLDLSQLKPLNIDINSNSRQKQKSDIFSKENIGAAASAAGGAIGGAISGGFNTGAGSVLSGVGDIASNFGPWGQVIGAAANILGGLTNRAFGSQINEQAVQEAKSQIGSTGSQGFNSENLNNGLNLMGTINQSDIGKDGWFSNKAKNLTRSLNQAAYRANNAQQTALNTAATQQTQSELRNLAANYAAYGGPITMRYSGAMSPFGNQFGDGGGIHIKPSKRGTFTAAAKKHGKSVQEFANQVLTNKDKYSSAMVKKANFARNAAKWKHADGGSIYTHGGIFSNGITNIGSGGTHEQNPFEGVQMGVDGQGVPNLVEEDEVVFNDYVFSDRLRVPKAVRERYKLGNNKNMSFADAAKKLSKESEERPNDPISKDGLEVMLGELASIQEDERFKKQMRDPEFRRQVMEQLAMQEAATQEGNQEMMQEQQADQAYQDPALQGMMFARGGRLGNLFDGTGSGSQWLNMDTMFDGLSFDNSNLEENIPYTHGSKSNLGQGVSTEDFNAFTDYALTLPDTNKYWTTLAEKTGKEVPWLKSNYKRLRSDGKYGWVSVTPQRLTSNGNAAVSTPGNADYISQLQEAPNTTTATPQAAVDTKATGNSEEEPPTEIKGVKDNWMRYVPIVGSGAAVLNDFLGGNEPDYSSANTLFSAVNNSYFKPVSPRYIGEQLTYRPLDRNYYINKLNSSFNSTRRDIMNAGRGNRGATMASLLANSVSNNESLGKLARQAEEYNMDQREKVATFNRDTSKFNASMGFDADKANQDALANYRNFRLSGLSEAAKLREAERLRVINDRSANLTNFLQGLGDLGREKTDRDMLRWLADLGVLVYNPSGKYTGANNTAATAKTVKKKTSKSKSSDKEEE